MTNAQSFASPPSESLETRVRHIIYRCTDLQNQLGELSAEASLWDAGMDSLCIVRIVVTVEEEFDVEFPAELLTRSTFNNIGAIASAVRTMLRDNAASSR
jgi:acyl carrier protein